MQANATLCQETRSEIYIHARQTKMLIWADLHRGECEQSNGELVLRSDGTGTWSCDTHSCSPCAGDVWHADFAVKDMHGVTLFGLGPFYSPRMDSGTLRRSYRWTASFTFPADLFTPIHAAIQNCFCLPPSMALKQRQPPEVVVDPGWRWNHVSRALGEAYV